MKPVILNLLSFSQVFKREALQTFICTLGREKKGKKERTLRQGLRKSPWKENAEREQHNFKS